ncbi:MAG: outer membrane beta-barrel protein [Pseudomonadota bacterium]|nr:outer membrane beta-barrel protein [Pseudomonadota bacterium]
MSRTVRAALLVLSLSSLVCARAEADAEALARAPSEAGLGPYAGAGIGFGSVHFDAIGLHETGSADPGTAGGKLLLGYWLTPVWGVELGYARLGKVSRRYSGATFSGHADSEYLALVVHPLRRGPWSLLAKAMLARSQLHEDAGSSALPQFAALRGSHGNLLVGAIGVEYAWDERLALALEADAYGKAGDHSGASLVSLDLSWHF